MKILLIHQAFVSPGEAGGTRHYELASRCVQQGHPFTIVASALSYLTGQPVANTRGLVSEQNLAGIRVLRAYTYPSLHRSFVWRVVAFVSFMFSSLWAGLRAGRVDLVMGTSPPIFQAVSAWLLAALRRRPFLLEIRDLWPEFAIAMGVLTNPVLIRSSRWLEHFLYARASRLLVNSPAYRDYLVQHGVAPEKITLIPNGVDPDAFQPESRGAAFRAQWKLDGKFVVTYAGALGLANDLATLLRAARRLREHTDILFLLVGDGKERANLQKMADELGLSNLLFTGALPKSTLPEVLAASDVCVATLKDIPVFRTTYPNKVFDYMAAGRPTILAIDGVIRQVLDAARGGLFVNPGRDDLLAQAVLHLKDHPDDARKMGIAARRHVEQHFNRHLQAGEFVRLMENGFGNAGR